MNLLDTALKGPAFAAVVSGLSLQTVFALALFHIFDLNYHRSHKGTVKSGMFIRLSVSLPFEVSKDFHILSNLEEKANHGQDVP